MKTRLAAVALTVSFAVQGSAWALIPKVPGILVAGTITIAKPSYIDVHVLSTGGRDTSFKHTTMRVTFDAHSTVYVDGRLVKRTRLRVKQYVSIRLKPNYHGGYIAKQVIVKPKP